VAETSTVAGTSKLEFRRVLRLRDLILYGIIIIQPVAPMSIFGAVSQEARGHVVTAILIAMVAMLFTAFSYGRMANVYPSAGSAYSYVSKEIHPGLGFLTGWSITLDYLINPVICTIWCSEAVVNFLPWLPYWVVALALATTITLMNLRGVESTARVNRILTAAMGIVVVLFFGATIHYLTRQQMTATDFLRPFYNPSTFAFRTVWAGTAIAALTYIGFDSISTLSEEVENPRRNILLATVLTCAITGVLASAEVYAGQLAWPNFRTYPNVDTAFVHIAGRVGGPLFFGVMNMTLLTANFGSALASQIAAARLLFGMGRDNVIPARFFGVLNPRTRIPQNNVLLAGVLTLAGALSISFSLGAELLNFGAFIAFMGVNLAAFIHYCVRGGRWSLRYSLPPVAGFLVCFYIWLSLGNWAKTVGGIWLAVGLVYGAVRGNLKSAPRLQRGKESHA
jgi:putrescine importer